MRIIVIILATLMISSCSVYPDDSSKVIIKITNPSDNDKNIKVTAELEKPIP